MEKPFLQVALDLVELERAVQIAGKALSGGADWIEVGTPLIKSEGMSAVTRLKSAYPDNVIVADMKIADTGAIEVEMAAKAGADIVCVLAAADDAVILEAVRAASKYGVKIMGDLLSVADPATRAKELEAMGVDYLVMHVGIDQQMTGREVSDSLPSVVDAVGIPVAAAGGLNAKKASDAVAIGASIVIAGGSIIRAFDVKEASKNIRDAIDNPRLNSVAKPDLDSQIYSILSEVSAPNVTDAMHRKGSMSGIFSLNPGNKAIGKAITVQTFSGDFAKTVEAIDLAGKGEVLVINNDHCNTISPWGELATHSAKNNGIEGVVIDGPARDVDEIRNMNYPLWCTGMVPNAGEPKGFGEIGSEISCCGQRVRTGDWIIADDSGVVVIPKESAYEIARRALMVKENEIRVRAEIAGGKTLAEVMNLLRWEKK